MKRAAPRTQRTLILLTALVVLASSTRVSSQGSNLILVGGWLIDGTGAPPVDDGWVWIEGGRIAAVGRGEPPSVPGARIMNVRGRTILPGLSDMHVHLGALVQAKWMLKILLAHGVTHIKETGNSLGNLAAIRRWVEDELAVPHMLVSGYAVDGDFIDLQFIQEGPATETILEDNRAFGVDFLKVYNWVSSGSLKQAGRFAREHDLILTDHVPLSGTSIAGIDAGMQILEHLRLRPWEVLDDPDIIARYPIDLSVTRRSSFWAHLDPEGESLGRTLDAWEKRKDEFYLDPTIVVQWAITHADGESQRTLEPKLNLISPALLHRWRTSGRRGETGEDALTEEEFEVAKRSVQGWMTFSALAHQKGIRILTGTDTAVEWVIPGYSLHQELRFLADAGIPVVEVIRSSTSLAAEATRSTDRGTLASGKHADIVIVEGNLAEDISAIENIEHVILDGRVYGRADLLEQAHRLAQEDLPPAGASPQN